MDQMRCDCRTAIAAARQAGRGVICGMCGADVYAPPLPVPPRYAPDPPPALPPLEWPATTNWRWEPNVRLDMAALAYSPGAGEQPPGWLAVLETEIDREVREERRTIRATNARKRLAAMRAHEGGSRYADIVWEVYGQRGEQLNARESCAAIICDRWATAGEKAAYRQRLGDIAAADAAAVVGLGNALIGYAVDAYEHDVWAQPASIVVDTPPKKTGRQEFVARLRESFDTTRQQFDRLAARLKKTTGT